MQAAFDGGSHSVIANNGVLGPPPLNIDDSSIVPGPIQSTYIEQPGLTDMSYNCMMHEALICWRRLTHIPTDFKGQPAKIRQDWTERSAIVTDWEQRIHEKYLQHCDSTQPFQNFMLFVGQDMIITMRLLERRPMHRLFSAGPPPPPNNDFNVLKRATDVLERSLLKFSDPGLAPWRWFAWVKWYALAIVLAELCGQTGNGGLVDRAWKVAEEAFDKLAGLVIDDVLWTSVGKLRQKARSWRDDGLRASSLSASKAGDTRTTSSHGGDISTGRLSGETDRLQDQAWAWDADVGAHDQSSRSAYQSELGTQTGGSTMPVAVPAEDAVMETTVDESEYMSWVNWELFVQDVGDCNEQEALEAQIGVSCNKIVQSE